VKLLHRQPIYEKDRIDPVDPAARLELDAEALAKFPEGYRHLAYIQTPDRLHGQEWTCPCSRARWSKSSIDAAAAGWPAANWKGKP